MSNIDLSIIIVNYNVKDFLFQCLKSIEKASEIAFNSGFKTEVIVIDNNSNDGSVGFLKPHFKFVKFIELKENSGFSRANNIGNKNSIGKYLLILNPDTILEENNLLKMLQFMEQNPDVGVAGCKVLNADGTFQLGCRRGFPTPWASFTKLFGLQKLFPGSKFFAQYNQTYKSIDETYSIDAITGAYMFIRKEIFEKINGFDEDFFMYGEDIDLCLRISQNSCKIVYYHETSIIHYKGESTRRSSMNELYHFYNAMEIFTRKHYSSSLLFLFLLKLGINIRSVFAYLNKNKRQIAIILFDLIVINISLMLGTYYKFEGILNFPSYAYPTVFIAISIILFCSMVAVGDYFEGKHTLRRSFFAFMLSFFLLSSLTYYFREYAFSRGVLLFTIGFASVLSILFRLCFNLYDKLSGRESDRRIAIIGINEQSMKLINKLRSGEGRNVNIIGLISTGVTSFDFNFSIPVIGEYKFLNNVIQKFDIDEVIIIDSTVNKSEMLKIISNISDLNVKFHIVSEYEDFLASRIINDISESESISSKYNILKIRYRIIKRAFDIVVSVFLLTIGLPLVYLLRFNKSNTLKDILKVMKGKYSLVGLYELKGLKPVIGKLGLTGLAHISKPNGLPEIAIEDLNEYYIVNYSFSLDVDILLKHLFRK